METETMQNFSNKIVYYRLNNKLLLQECKREEQLVQVQSTCKFLSTPVWFTFTKKYFLRIRLGK